MSRKVWSCYVFRMSLFSWWFFSLKSSLWLCVCSALRFKILVTSPLQRRRFGNCIYFFFFKGELVILFICWLAGLILVLFWVLTNMFTNIVLALKLILKVLLQKIRRWWLHFEKANKEFMEPDLCQFCVCCHSVFASRQHTWQTLTASGGIPAGQCHAKGKPLIRW